MILHFSIHYHTLLLQNVITVYTNWKERANSKVLCLKTKAKPAPSLQTLSWQNSPCTALGHRSGYPYLWPDKTVCTSHMLQLHCQLGHIGKSDLLAFWSIVNYQRKIFLCLDPALPTTTSSFPLPFPAVKWLSVMYPLCLVWLLSRLFCLLASQLHSLQPSKLAACMAGCQGICSRTLVYLLPLRDALNKVFAAWSSSYYGSIQEKHS